MTLPIKEPLRGHLMNVRRGQSTVVEVLDECNQVELRLSDLLHSSPLPVEPDVKTVESFVMDTYADAWMTTGQD
jgi:hypothetical protein